MPIRKMFLILVATAAVGCVERASTVDVSCDWQGAGQFAEYATNAQARLSNDRLTALRIVSKVGVIADGSEGTCVYDLREQHFEHVLGDDGMPRLRFVNDRNEGTG